MEVLQGKILSNRKIANLVYEMIIEGKFVEHIKFPGQFLSIKINDSKMILRRPISICDYDESKCTIIYKNFGEGTKFLSNLNDGETIDILYPLGNGFSYLPENKKVLVIGGGVGVPPLYKLTKILKEKNCDITTVLGFSTSEDVFYENEFANHTNTFISTLDGSYKSKGTVIQLINENFLYENVDIIYACGPNGMLKSINEEFNDKEIYISLEERMACSIGACYACVCKTKNDSYKLVCKDGPVFNGKEVIL